MREVKLSKLVEENDTIVLSFDDFKRSSNVLLTSVTMENQMLSEIIEVSMFRTDCETFELLWHYLVC